LDFVDCLVLPSLASSSWSLSLPEKKNALVGQLHVAGCIRLRPAKALIHEEEMPLQSSQRFGSTSAVFRTIEACKQDIVSRHTNNNLREETWNTYLI
jgi:hypothetical protein